mgnify:CR=1 FL=1
MRIIFVVFYLLISTFFSVCGAQSLKSLSRVQKAVVSVNTYDKNGDLLKSGTAFYIGPDGDAVADYSLFKNAYRAIVVDMNGKQYDVDCINGADDTYSIIRFKVIVKNNAYMNIAAAGSDNGSTVYLVPFSREKIKKCADAIVESYDSIQGKYLYYTLSSCLDSLGVGCPVLNAKGEVTAIMQPSVDGKGYALDIRFKDELKIKAISSSSANIALTNVYIPKGIPDTVEEALVYAYFKSRSSNNDEYLDVMNRFVESYPNNADGYIRRCVPLIDMRRFDEADADMQRYLSLSTDKANAYFNISQTVYNKLVYMPTPEYPKWSFDYAIDYADKSSAIYQSSADTAKWCEALVLKAKILTDYKKFDESVAVYDFMLHLNENNKAPLLYAKSLVCEKRGDSDSSLIVIMDSAVSCFPSPLPRDAANYVLRRGQLYSKVGKSRKAVSDYNEYCYLVNNQVSDVFYYDRSQIEMDARFYQQAYDDISKAIEISPKNLDYKAEKAAMCLRFGYVDETVSLCEDVLAVVPDDVTCLRILGYSLLQKGDKEKARAILNKAVELGDSTSKEIMDKYLK